jgi:hypothetical protein
VSLIAALHAGTLIAAECGCGRRGGLLTGLILATSTAVINVAVDGKTDLLALAPSFSAALWALRLTASSGIYMPVLIGLLAGTAVGVKLTYFVPLAASLLSLVGAAALAAYRSGHAWVVTTVMRLLVIGVMAAAISLPQLLKNAMHFSMPLYPLIGSAGWGVDKAWYSPDVTRRILLTLPFAITFGEYWAQHGAASPLILGLLPLLLFYRSSDPNVSRPLTRILVAGAIGTGAWFVVNPSQLAPRYFLASLLLLAIPAAWAGQRAWDLGPKPLGRTIVAFAFLVAAVATIEVYLSHARPAWLYISERVDKGEKACANDTYCEASQIVNSTVRPGERIAFRSWYRYFLRPDILQCIVSDIQLPEGLTASSLRAAGTRYIFIDRFQFPNPEVPTGLAVEPVFENQLYAFYRITDPPPEVTSRCVEEQPGRWRVVKPAS